MHIINVPKGCLPNLIKNRRVSNRRRRFRRRRAARPPLVYLSKVVQHLKNTFFRVGSNLGYFVVSEAYFKKKMVTM